MDEWAARGPISDSLAKTAQRSSRAVPIEKSDKPWQWGIAQRSLIIRLPESYRVLSWAPFRGGSARARVIVNHQIVMGDRIATENPRPYLAALVRRLGFKPLSAIAMMTGARIDRTAHAVARRGNLIVGAWCTAGCSNAMRIGDPATFKIPQLGTINLAVVANQPLSPAAMAEALAMATEARVTAVHDAGILSTRTNRPATGTGTDCIVIAAPVGGGAHSYCGKHTVLGELIGKAAMRSCAKALRRPEQ